MTFPFSPSSPPRLHVEPLPANATVASVQRTTTERGKAAVTISAWLPDGWSTADVPTVRRGSSNDAYERFYNTYCDGCDYNCSEIDINGSDLDDLQWEDRHGVTWQISCASAYSPCAVGDGNATELQYIDWPCCAGYDEPEDDDDEEDDGDMEEDFLLGPMRFSTTRLTTSGSYPLLDTVERFTAVLQATSLRDTTWRFSRCRRVCNTYDPSQGICWGNRNTVPSSLAEAAAAYADAECNSDLLNVSQFRRNTADARSDSDFYVEHSSHLLFPIGPWQAAQAIVVADAISSPDAFLLLAASGAPVKDGIAATSARWVEELPIAEGHTFTGWRTRPLAGTHSWLIGQISTGDELIQVLLGQHSALVEPHDTPLLIPV